VFGPLFPAGLWVLYLVWVGGDWMPGNRHFALVLVLLTVSLVRAITTSGVYRYSSKVLGGVLLAVSLVTGAVSMNAPAAAERTVLATTWLQFLCEGSEQVSVLFEEYDPLVAVENVGCIPYVTGFDSLDMLGLADIHVSGMTPTGRPITWDEWLAMRLADVNDPRLGRSFMPGHGNGDGVYVWDREPDLIVTCGPVDPAGAGCFRSWFEMKEAFDLASRYRLLTIDTNRWELWNAWVRYDDGVLGVRQTRVDGELVALDVPVWLLTASRRAPLVLDETGQATVEARRNALVDVPPLLLAAGRWEVEGVPSTVEMTSASTCARLLTAGAGNDVGNDVGNVLEVAGDSCEVRLSLRANEDSRLEGLAVRRAS
jgi:hypothetical protein